MHLEITHPPLNHGCQVSDSWHGTQAVNKLMPPAFLCWASVSASRVLNSTTQALSSSPALLCPLGHAFCWAHSRWLINSYRGNQWNVKRPWVDSPRSLCYERQGALQQQGTGGCVFVELVGSGGGLEGGVRFLEKKPGQGQRKAPASRRTRYRSFTWKRVSGIKGPVRCQRAEAYKDACRKPTSVLCRHHCHSLALCSPSWHGTQALNKSMPICECYTSLCCPGNKVVVVFYLLAGVPSGSSDGSRERHKHLTHWSFLVPTNWGEANLTHSFPGGSAG